LSLSWLKEKKGLDLELNFFLNTMVYENVSLKKDMVSKGD
jgi:hypothetical protein